MKAVFPAVKTTQLQEVFDSGYVGAGELVTAFEEALKDYLAADNVIATSTCTAALDLAYVLAGIGHDSVVLSTPMTCAATNIPLLLRKARVRWLDVDPLSGNVTPQAVSAGLTEWPTAEAVVIMDWGGVPCDYPSISDICRSYDKLLILDAAQSFGTVYNGSRLPRCVNIICYSFGPTKILSCIEGGAVVTPSGENAERSRALRWYGIHRDNRDPVRFWEYEVAELGFRYTTNNVFAAVGLTSLSIFEERLEHHQRLAYLYDRGLAGIAGLDLSRRPTGSIPNFWLYTALASNRDALLEKLHREGIHAATPHRRNDHLLAPHQVHGEEQALPGLDEFSDRYLCLPVGPWVDESHVEYICKTIQAGW